VPALPSSAAPSAAPAARPLVVTGDVVLLDELLRLTAAAGGDAHVAADPGAARSGWIGAPLVLVGGDLADGVAALVRSGALPRRDGVVIVTADLDDAGVWQRAVAVGAEHVACLPDAEPWLVDRLGAAADGPGAGGMVLGVLGGRGGAGATVLATAMAMAGLRAGLRTMLVDADPLGGGIDLVLGAEREVGVRWSGLTGVRGRLPAGALHEALPAVGELTVLSWDGPPDVRSGATEAAMSALLTAARAGSDLVVVDLPRHLDEAARTALAAASQVLLVVPAELRACSAAARVLAGIRDRVDIGLVVRRGAGRLPDTVVAESLGLRLVGALRPEPGLADCLERGEPPGRGPGPLARLCDRVVADLTATGRRG
jgi:secretion/DNA translocation related CpaE-like protein